MFQNITLVKRCILSGPIVKDEFSLESGIFTSFIVISKSVMQQSQAWCGAGLGGNKAVTTEYNDVANTSGL